MGKAWTANRLLLMAVALAGCGLPGTAPRGPEAAPTAAPGSEARPLVVLVEHEPANVAARPLTSAGAALRFQQRVFNALLTLIDAQGLPQPELLASLPALNTSSWQVFPDGTMQTTYTLRPNLTWHDGQPFTPDDFVFAWRVYSSADLGAANQPPMSAMSDVAAIDPEHFTIQWKRPYPDADSLSLYMREFPALPQHILGPVFDQMATTGRESFVSHPFWAQQYVGLGPFRIQDWQTGAFIDMVRFEGYALGAPKITRMQMRFGADQNVVVASLLSGAAHLATSGAAINRDALMDEWSRTNAGQISLSSISVFNYLSFQLRPDLANPGAILDPRVRKSIAHAVDKQALVDTLFNGGATLTHTPVWTGSAWGPAVDNSIITYPYDLRASETLMNQAGFTKGSDGFYRGGGGRLGPVELVTTASQDQVQEMATLADWLGAAGFDVKQRVIPAAQAQDNEVRSTFPGALINNTNSGESALNNLSSAAIPSPNNRWVGSNRGGWSSPDYDRLLSTFNTTLDRRERVELVRQMLRLYSEELPYISLILPHSYLAALTGLRGPVTVAPEANTAWNVYEWEFQ